MSAKTQAVNLLQLSILPRHFIYNQSLWYKAIPLPLISFFISQFTNYCLSLCIPYEILTSFVHVLWIQSFCFFLKNIFGWSLESIYKIICEFGPFNRKKLYRNKFKQMKDITGHCLLLTKSLKWLRNMIYRNLCIFLTILHFIIPFSPCIYTEEEMCIALSIGFQKMGVWGQRKSTGSSDRKRSKPSLSNIEIQT